jgi:tRNA (cytidine/uridine-2'-O-)-methyltransferase
MRQVNIVLVEPLIPQNTGNIARTCAATGAALHLIRPLGFEIDSAKLKRAGLDYWDSLDITYYDGLSDFFAKHPEAEFFCFTSKAKRSYTDVAYPLPVYLFFGKETSGLPTEFTSQHPDRCVRLPMREGQRCLNLSNAAAVGVYEVLRQRPFEGLRPDGELTQYHW